MANSRAGAELVPDKPGTSFLLEIKEVFQKMMRHVTGTLKPAWRGSYWPNLGQLEHQNNQIQKWFINIVKIEIHESTPIIKKMEGSFLECQGPEISVDRVWELENYHFRASIVKIRSDNNYQWMLNLWGLRFCTQFGFCIQFQWGEGVPTHHQVMLWYQWGVLQFNSILPLSTWR